MYMNAYKHVCRGWIKATLTKGLKIQGVDDDGK